MIKPKDLKYLLHFDVVGLKEVLDSFLVVSIDGVEFDR